jgi:hypothetical protein
LAEGQRRSLLTPTRPETPQVAPPVADPVEALRLLEIVSPSAYRGLCAMLRYRLTELWTALDVEARQTAMQTFDTRFPATPRPAGTRLV